MDDQAEISEHSGEEAPEDVFTHYVHLADGRVVKADLSDGSTVGASYDGSTVIGVYPK